MRRTDYAPLLSLSSMVGVEESVSRPKNIFVHKRDVSAKGPISRFSTAYMPTVCDFSADAAALFAVKSVLCS